MLTLDVVDDVYLPGSVYCKKVGRQSHDLMQLMIAENYALLQVQSNLFFGENSFEKQGDEEQVTLIMIFI